MRSSSNGSSTLRDNAQRMSVDRITAQLNQLRTPSALHSSSPKPNPLRYSSPFLNQYRPASGVAQRLGSGSPNVLRGRSEVNVR